MKIFLLIILTLHLASSTHQGHLMTRKLQSILTFATTKSNYQPLCLDFLPNDFTLNEILSYEKNLVSGENYYVHLDFAGVDDDHIWATVGVWVKKNGRRSGV